MFCNKTKRAKRLALKFLVRLSDKIVGRDLAPFITNVENHCFGVSRVVSTTPLVYIIRPRGYFHNECCIGA